MNNIMDIYAIRCIDDMKAEALTLSLHDCRLYGDLNGALKWEEEQENEYRISCLRDNSICST